MEDDCLGIACLKLANCFAVPTDCLCVPHHPSSPPQEDIQEDFGWKLVHGDVFRPPTFSMLLSVCVGSGGQLLVMVVISLGEGEGERWMGGERQVQYVRLH